MVTVVTVVTATSSAPPTSRLLSFNDLHGNLEPPSGSSGRLTTGYTESTTTPYAAVPTTVNAGGTEYLATHLQQARKGHRDTVTAAAGDLVGASPLLSAAFHDEPTVEAMNALGLDVTSVGNHEFDEGYKEIQRLARGGCIDDGDGAANQNSCADHTFRGARYPILAANVKYAGTNKTILPPYWIKTFKDGAKIGFIGMTLKDTPSIVTKSGIEGLQFTDEAQTANALVPVLKRQGVKAIVVLVHQGGDPATTTYTAEHGTYQVAPPYDATCSTETKQGVKGAQARERQRDPRHHPPPRPADRHGRERPHPPAVRLLAGRQQGPPAAHHQRLVVRPALHRDEPHLRPAQGRHRPLVGRGHQRGGLARRGGRPEAVVDHLDVQAARAADPGPRARPGGRCRRAAQADQHRPRLDARPPHRRRPGSPTRASPAAAPRRSRS
ncbi:hypothetical protein GCM10025868_28160 [Angustibacter aerolatus]|uniref:Calcineurin-like phosphoesterase domain-containing protein n=1 Tax=Angustibacter aerolatus TaxID=1162965 RepID=A0ABQ6JH67_9ACTN|nr:hypothetical protein [Angustibacter aerolatus]GMA87566.1 hypothetical protein GCM10025868_28160 [Angustibacter aerolatus]